MTCDKVYSCSLTVHADFQNLLKGLDHPRDTAGGQGVHIGLHVPLEGPQGQCNHGYQTLGRRRGGGVMGQGMIRGDKHTM